MTPTADQMSEEAALALYGRALHQLSPQRQETCRAIGRASARKAAQRARKRGSTGSQVGTAGPTTLGAPGVSLRKQYGAVRVDPLQVVGIRRGAVVFSGEEFPRALCGGVRSGTLPRCPGTDVRQPRIQPRVRAANRDGGQ